MLREGGSELGQEEMNERVITVFGSSRARENDADYQEALQLGCTLGKAGFDVCTGGYGGVMEAVSRGAKTAGAMTYGVTTEFFTARANAWIDREIRMDHWQQRLFELIRIGDGFVACKGGTGTLAEIAVVWEMLNKSVIAGKPLVVLGEFWLPVLERVREVELGHPTVWGECTGKLVHSAATPPEATEFLQRALLSR